MDISSKRKINIKRSLLIIFLVISIIKVVSLFFGFAGDNYPDEVFADVISYYLSLGKTPLVDCREIFQTGDMFMLPFIYVFTFITGNTDGIILYLRFCCLFLICLVAIYSFFIVRYYVDDNVALLTALFIFTCTPLNSEYWTYDTALMNFVLVSSLSVVYGYYTENKKYLFLGGFFLGLVVFSYPTAIIYALFYICLVSVFFVNNKKNKLIKWFVYGGLLVILLFCIYCAIVGFSNLFFVSSSNAMVVTSGRLTNYSTRFGLLGEIAYTNLVVLVNNKDILISYILILLVMKLSKNKGWIIQYVLLMIMLIIPLLLANQKWFGLYNQLNYYTCLYFTALGIYLFLDKAKKKELLPFLVLLVLPCIIIMNTISLSTAYKAGGKGQYGLYAGACIVLLVIYFFLKERIHNKNAFEICSIIVCLVPSMYNTIVNVKYSNDPNYSKSNYVVETGICKGLIINKSEAIKIEEQQKQFLSLVEQTDQTVVVSSQGTMMYYLFSDLEPYTQNLWKNWDDTESELLNADVSLYKENNEYPDIIILDAHSNVETFSESIGNMILTHYELVDSNQYFWFYRYTTE